MSGIKHDQKKIRTDLMPGDAIMEISKVLTFGAAKYTKEYTLLDAIWLMARTNLAAHNKSFLNMLLDCIDTATKKISISDDITKSRINLKAIESVSDIVPTILHYTNTMRQRDYLADQNNNYLSGKRADLLRVTEKLVETPLLLNPSTPQDWLINFFNQVIVMDPDCTIIAHNYLKSFFGATRIHQLEISGPNKIIISGERNWELGFNWSRVYGALQRHITLWFHGQDKDPETGKSHLAHAGCCLVFLLTFVLRNTGKDDRVKLSAEELDRMSKQDF